MQRSQYKGERSSCWVTNYFPHIVVDGQCDLKKWVVLLGDHSVVGRDQAPSGLRIFNPRISGTGFHKILGFWDFSGQDKPEISIPGFNQKKSWISQLIKLANFVHFGRLICWWKIPDKSLPLLAFFGQGHLPHPVTSSKSERMFSVADNVVTPKRACLAPEYVEV